MTKAIALAILPVLMFYAWRFVRERECPISNDAKEALMLFGSICFLLLLALVSAFALAFFP